MPTNKKSPVLTRRTSHKHVYNSEGMCKCGTLSRPAQVRKNRDEIEAAMQRTYPEHYDAYAAADQTYMLILERETPRDNEVGACPIVTSGNAFQALQVAYALARPGKNDVLILTWTNHAGDKHELSTKVLANRITN